MESAYKIFKQKLENENPWQSDLEIKYKHYKNIQLYDNDK